MNMASNLSLEAASNEEVAARQTESEENSQSQEEKRSGAALQGRDEKALRRHWVMFACGHACSMGGAIYAFDLVTALDKEVFRIGTSILFTMAVLASLVSSVLVERMGPKRSTVIGCVMFGVFTAASSAALSMPHDVRWQWPLYVFAAINCGWAVALLGAAFGPMLNRTAVLVSELRGGGSDEASLKIASADLVADFSVMTTGLGLFIVVLGAVTIKFLHAGVVAGEIAVLCFAGAIVSACCIDLPPSEASCTKSKTCLSACLSDVRALRRFYAEPRAWLLAPGALAMGGYSSWKTSTMAVAAQRSLGNFGVTMLNLMQNVCGLIFVKIYQAGLERSKTFAVLTCGSGAILLAVCLFHFTDIAERGYWVVVFYALGGVSWPAFEVGTKAVIANHFQGDQAAPAFASLTLQMFGVQAVIFFVSNFGDKEVHGYVVNVVAVFVAVFACLIVPGTAVAERLFQGGKAKDSSAAAEGRSLEDGVARASA